MCTNPGIEAVTNIIYSQILNSRLHRYYCYYYYYILVPRTLFSLCHVIEYQVFYSCIEVKDFGILTTRKYKV